MLTDTAFNRAFEPRDLEPRTAQDLAFSFEFFPPRTAEMGERLWLEIKRLEPLNPRFVSVTYGAGGSTRDRTHAIVSRICNETELLPAAHLTCVDATREEVDQVARAYWDAGVRHIVALRGDPQGAGEGYSPAPGGYAYAADLVAGLKRVADFEISVAAYPEMHPDAASAGQDLDNLKRKLDAGACRAITQFFFDPDCYLRFVDRARAAGIDAPIVPGILPITNFARTVEFAGKCGATIPPWLAALFEGLQDDGEISVAAYPEMHPDAASAGQDLDNLKRKLDAGACRAITQFFFDPDCYLRFVDRARAAGIDAPIVPGILPITNFARTVEFAGKCGATIPPWLAALFEGLQDDGDTRDLVAAVAAAEQCRHLQAHGVSEFHFYTLNKAELTTAICRLLQAPIPITGFAQRAARVSP